MNADLLKLCNSINWHQKEFLASFSIKKSPFLRRVLSWGDFFLEAISFVLRAYSFSKKIGFYEFSTFYTYFRLFGTYFMKLVIRSLLLHTKHVPTYNFRAVQSTNTSCQVPANCLGACAYTGCSHKIFPTPNPRCFHSQNSKVENS